jgi:predicted hydrocarbon binding protein
MLAEFLKKAIFSRMFTADEGKIKLLKSDYMLVHVPAMAEMIYDFSKIKGGKKKLYDTGYDSGEDVMLDFKSVLSPAKIIVNTMMNTMMGVQEMLGWGKFDLKKFDKKKSYMVIHWDSAIARAMIKKFGRQDEPMCSWPCGVLAGALGVLLDDKLQARETKCIAKGDEYCELIIERKTTKSSKKGA